MPEHLMPPLISIILPCYDAVDTLPLALGSLRAQTVGDWECLVVDDGCAVPVEPVVRAVGDGRIRVHRFEENRGRGAARQKGLEMARGRYVCMLDADDWYYRDKLERQLEVMRRRPELGAVFMSMAVFRDVIGSDMALVGVSTFTEEPFEVRKSRRHRPPQVAFSTVMIRRHLAQRFRFDTDLRRAEDQDFFTRVLGGRHYGVLRDVGYAYRESWSPGAMGEALLAFRCRRRCCRRDFRRAPVAMGVQYAKTLLREGVYRAAGRVGGGRWLFERRNEVAGEEEIERFRREFRGS